MKVKVLEYEPLRRLTGNDVGADSGIGPRSSAYDPNENAYPSNIVEAAEDLECASATITSREWTNPGLTI